jgi:glycosyltransferase involved in cell wall biosynthesis
MAAELDRPCHVVPHGVDLDRFEPMPRETARREVDWEDEERVVFFPYATNRPVKNYPLAERVATTVDRRLDDDVAIKTVSGVPHERMVYYYNAADALLLTSRREGSPNSVKEAMACDLPVVGTDVGDLRDRLDGVTPSAVCSSEAELVDRLATVLERGRRSNGREQVRELGFERTGERLKSVFETAIEGH